MGRRPKISYEQVLGAWQRFKDDGVPVAQLAKDLNVTPATLYNRFEGAGFWHKHADVDWHKIDPERVARAHEDGGLSLEQIARALRISWQQASMLYERVKGRREGRRVALEAYEREMAKVVPREEETT